MAAAQIVSQLGNIVNTTLSSSTYTTASSFGSALKANAMPNDLYAGIDFDALSYPEQLWARWYLWIGDPVLATGIMSFLMHEIFYFGRCIPWIIIDRIPYFNRFKLQDDKIPTRAEQWKCTKYVLYTHFTIELPQIAGFEPMATYFGMATHQVPFPRWTTIVPQIIGFFFFEDFWHYWLHRALHQGVLYRRIHKLHHEYSAPFGLAAEYAHPLEIALLGAGTIGGPLLWCWWSGGNLHVITMYIWIICRLWQAVDSHSGYDFAWSLNRFIPIWGGAEHHDSHHELFVGNYSSSFRHWDVIFGTDKAYKASAKKREAKRAAIRAKAEQAEEDRKAGKAKTN